eukprot:g1316.t1
MRPARSTFDLGRDSYSPQSWKDDLKCLGGSEFLSYPLHVAVQHGRADIVRRILDEGYDKERVDGEGRTPIHHAAMKGDMASTNALLQAGPRRGGYYGYYTSGYIGRRCHNGRSALDLAVEEGHVDIVKRMATSSANVDEAGAGGNTPLHLAAMGDKAEIVSVLCAWQSFSRRVDRTKENDRGYTPLHEAAHGGHVAATIALIAAGVDVNLRPGALSVPALSLAASRGHVDVVGAFLLHGARVNAADIKGFTALHNASTSTNVGVIDALIEAGANVEARLYGSRETPLHLAASNSSCLEAVSALLRHGARVDPQTAQGGTPLHYAAASAGRAGIAGVVDLLLRWGADENVTNDLGQTPNDVVGSRVQEQNDQGEGVERVRSLLADAPADRAWRRRGFLVMCRAHYPGGRVQLVQGSSHTFASVWHRAAATLSPANSKAEAAGVEIEWANVASMLMGVGDRGAVDLVFEAIVAYL